ncbi:MAG: ABC transporter substrate-binding protein [Negativicutes bacterium]|nr:ABC transporter substrate-binding protein [Negativicutes bacterium]
MKKTGIIGLLAGMMLILTSLGITGCAGKGNTESKKPIVAVTIVPEKTFVEAVCGNLAEVVVMVPPGNSPENYEPNPKQMTQFAKAKVFFAIGVPTEKTNILPKIDNAKNLKVVKLQEEVAKVYPERDIAPGERDPHIWLSPKRAKVMVKVIALEMGKIDPANKEQYEKNAKAYLAELDGLDKDIQKTLENVANKKFVVFHPAFGYLAADYNLQMYALEEEGKEATPQSMQAVIDLAKKEKIKAIFYQAEISSKQAQAFADEIGGKTVKLEPLAANYIANYKNMVKLMAEVMQ